MLDVPTAIRTALQGESLTYAWLVDIAGLIRLTDFATDITYAGETYTSQGDILGLNSIVRERDIKLQGYTVEIAGADPWYINMLRARNFSGEPCTVSLLMLDDDGDVISGQAIQLYKGSFDSWYESESKTTSQVQIKITSPWSKPTQTAGRMTSTNAQEDRYTGDKFFEFAHEEKTNLGWGGKA